MKHWDHPLTAPLLGNPEPVPGWLCPGDLPLVGHDYRYFIPRMLDTELHFRINGLQMQWYSTSSTAASRRGRCRRRSIFSISYPLFP